MLHFVRMLALIYFLLTRLKKVYVNESDLPGQGHVSSGHVKHTVAET